MMDKLLTIKQAAEYLQIHTQTLYKKREIPRTKIGGSIRFKKSDLEEYVEQNTINPPPTLNNQFLNLINLPRNDMSYPGGNGMAKAKSSSRKSFNVGIGSIYYRKFKCGVRWSIDYRDTTGKRIQRSITNAQNREDAIEALKDAVRKEFDKEYRAQREMGKMTFREYGKTFLDNYSKLHVTGWEKSDKVYIESILGSYFGEYQLRDINVLLIDKYKKLRLESGIQKSSINRELFMLRKVFNKAIAWQLIEKNPIDKVEFFKESKPRNRVLGRNEQERLLKVAKPWLQELVLFDVNTGLRPGKELLQELRWENVSFENGVAYLEKTKSGEPKTLYLNSVALDILKKRQANVGNGKGAVFGYSYYTVHGAFKRACKRAGIEGVTLHTLRHTFGTRLIENGADIVTTKDLLHHSSLEMTERYTHPDTKRNKDAVERLVQKGRGAVT